MLLLALTRVGCGSVPKKTTGLHNCWPVAPLARHERRCPNTRPWVNAAIARLLMAGTSPTCGVRVNERQRHKKPAARIAGRLHHWLGADSGAQVPSARHRRHQYAVVGIVAVWQVRHYREQPAAFRDQEALCLEPSPGAKAGKKSTSLPCHQCCVSTFSFC
jgi:hypothetical protein